MISARRTSALPAFRKPVSVVVLLGATLLAGCATNRTPQFSYDADVPPLPAVQASVIDDRPRPLHTPPGWTVARGGEPASTAAGRVENANAAARVEPRRAGYYNAIQVYPWSQGALYQVYAAPGQITDIALEPGESLTGAGPIAAGDTARWIIGDTTSGSGDAAQVHILVKPTRDQSHHHHRPAHLYDRAARPRSTLYACGGLGLSGATTRAATERARRANYPQGIGTQLPLRPDRRQPAMASSLGLR